jgi:hypothetical protein
VSLLFPHPFINAWASISKERNEKKKEKRK